MERINSSPEREIGSNNEVVRGSVGKKATTTGNENLLLKLSSEKKKKLKRLLEDYGAQIWSLPAEQLECLSGKNSGLRWHNELDPRINRDDFTQKEDEGLLALGEIFEKMWSPIANLFPGRTEIAVERRLERLLANKMAKGETKEQLDSFRNRKRFEGETCGIKRKRRGENNGDAKRKKGIDGRYTRCRAGEINIGCSSNGTENGTGSNAMPQVLASESHRNHHEERELTVPFIDFLGIGSI